MQRARCWVRKWKERRQAWREERGRVKVGGSEVRGGGGGGEGKHSKEDWGTERQAGRACEKIEGTQSWREEEWDRRRWSERRERSMKNIDAERKWRVVVVSSKQKAGRCHEAESVWEPWAATWRRNELCLQKHGTRMHTHTRTHTILKVTSWLVFSCSSHLCWTQ